MAGHTRRRGVPWGPRSTAGTWTENTIAVVHFYALVCTHVYMHTSTYIICGTCYCVFFRTGAHSPLNCPCRGICKIAFCKIAFPCLHPYLLHLSTSTTSAITISSSFKYLDLLQVVLLLMEAYAPITANAKVFAAPMALVRAAQAAMGHAAITMATVQRPPARPRLVPDAPRALAVQRSTTGHDEARWGTIGCDGM